MNTHTRSTGPNVDQVEPASGPVARIIAASVATALAAAATLVALVFPGATEATIIGSFLVAFGLGWTLLGWATTRFTNRPLDWTRVPAFAMTATGLALLVLAPQDAAMRTMSWVWPLPTIALAVSIWVRARRTVPRRGRWMLTAIAGVLAVTALGATYENISVVRDHHTYAAPGETYDVNGHQLYLACRGHGGPHGRAVQRHGRGLGVLGAHRRPHQHPSPGLHLRPRRPGLERRRRPAARRHHRRT
jgi:hypothetical protein